MDDAHNAESLAAAEAQLRAESSELARQYAGRIGALLADGSLSLAIDRGYARDWLSGDGVISQADSASVHLGPGRLFLFGLMLGEPLCALILIVLGFVLFGWWGVLLLIAEPILHLSLRRSAQIPHRRYWLCMVTFLTFVGNWWTNWHSGFATTLSFTTWCAAGALLALVIAAEYAYPAHVARTLAKSESALLPSLIAANVVFIRRPKQSGLGSAHQTG